jgi:hypothetical protein
VTITPVAANAAFDSEAMDRLAAAVEAAWQAVKASGSPLADAAAADSTHEMLAKRIFELAWRGESDQQRLVQGALQHLANVGGGTDIAAISEPAVARARVRLAPGCENTNFHDGGGGRVMQDAWERVADCERAIQAAVDPERRAILTHLRNLLVALANERECLGADGLAQEDAKVVFRSRRDP